MSGPLTGIKIIDLSTVVIGPYATQVLSDMGAYTIKVESEKGDDFRYTAPSPNSGMSAGHMQVNRNKECITLNLKKEEDLDILFELLHDADVFITNMRPKSLKKLGLSYHDLQEKHPKLIYCSITGFSEKGPYAGRPAYDDLIQAMGGNADLQGRHKDQYQPEYSKTIIVDKVTGLTAVYAVSMALYEREKSHLGQAIEIPMFETIVSFNLVEHMAEATFCHMNNPTMGYNRVLFASRKPYKTLDGYIGILPYNTAQWERFFTLSGHQEYLRMERFMNIIERNRNIDELYTIVAAIIATRTADEWLLLFKDADIPIARLNSLEDLLGDEHLLETEFFQYQKHPTEGEVRMCGIPTLFSRTPGKIKHAARFLGEDNDKIVTPIRAIIKDRKLKAVLD